MPLNLWLFFCNDPRYQDLPGYALYLKTNRPSDSVNTP